MMDSDFYLIRLSAKITAAAILACAQVAAAAPWLRRDVSLPGPWGREVLPLPLPPSMTEWGASSEPEPPASTELAEAQDLAFPEALDLMDPSFPEVPGLGGSGSARGPVTLVQLQEATLEATNNGTGVASPQEQRQGTNGTGTNGTGTNGTSSMERPDSQVHESQRLAAPVHLELRNDSVATGVPSLDSKVENPVAMPHRAPNASVALARMPAFLGNRSLNDRVILGGTTYRLADLLQLLQPHAPLAPPPSTSPSQSPPVAQRLTVVRDLSMPLELANAGVNETEGDAKQRILRGTFNTGRHAGGHQAPDEAVESGPFVLVTAVSGMVLVLLCFVAADLLSQSAPESEVRKWVESQAVFSAEEVEDLFRPRGGYDCLLMQPQEHEGAVRLEGRVVAPPTAALRAPITKRSCALFSASAAEKRLDGVNPPPLAFHAMNADFDILPFGDSGLRIKVRGQDVALFDMIGGRHAEVHALGDAPEHLQDFVRAHRVAASGASPTATGRRSPSSRSEVSTAVEFRESLLEDGAVVTCVGELRRVATGEICLWPLSTPLSPAFASASSQARSPTGGGFTSWETAGSGEAQVGKVMVSDDPRLLRTRGSPRNFALVCRCRALST